MRRFNSIDYFDLFFKIIFGAIALFFISFLSVFSFVLVNEYLDLNNKVTYCSVVVSGNHNKVLYSNEYNLIGVRRWRTTNIVLGVYPSAKEAAEAAKEKSCELRD